MTDKIRENGGGAAPGLQNPLLTGGIHLLNALQQNRQDVRSFLNTSTHVRSPLLTVGALDNELVRAVMMLAGLVTHRRLAPGGDLSLIHI